MRIWPTRKLLHTVSAIIAVTAHTMIAPVGHVVLAIADTRQQGHAVDPRTAADGIVVAGRDDRVDPDRRAGTDGHVLENPTGRTVIDIARQHRIVRIAARQVFVAHQEAPDAVRARVVVVDQAQHVLRARTDQRVRIGLRAGIPARDGSLAAHCEHTLVVTRQGPIILAA